MPPRWLARLAAAWGRVPGQREARPAPVGTRSAYFRLRTSGLVHAVCGRRDEAVRDLSEALRQHTDDASLTLVLGHLRRLQGQFDRAIRLHRMLLLRPDLDRGTRVSALVAAALDHRTAGLLEQARQNAEEALRLDPREPTALDLLARLHETLGDWRAALVIEERLFKVQPGRGRLTYAFLLYRIGCDYDERQQAGRAARSLLRAIKAHDGVVPAYVRLGDLHHARGHTDRALLYWERLLDRHPRHAYLVFERLESLYPELGLAGKLEEICRRLAAADPGDWRSRVYLSERATSRGDEPEASRWGLEALEASPRSLAAHRSYWRSAAPASSLPPRALRDFLKATSGAGDDPHRCTRCRYRASELLWRCPQCHAWASFIEDRG
ncbi:MAG: tetratricopeptide repeat protein [Acidobacteriota bacterium]